MILSLFNIVLAATSTYLWDVPLPPAPSGYLPSELSFESLLTYLYYWGLGIGGLLAFIRLIIAGIQWGASAGNVNSVKSAQDTMISSVFGLILLLGAWLLLNTINPQIVDPGEKITEALQQPKYESEGLKTELVDLNTYEVRTPERVNVSWNYFTGIGGIGGGGPLPHISFPPVPPSPGRKSLNEAGISCVEVNVCWDCNTPLPMTLINVLLEMKNQGINFQIWAGSCYGLSHVPEMRAVDIVPPTSGTIMDFLHSQSAALGGCGDELFAPGGEAPGVPDYGDRCYFNRIGLPTLDCSSREYGIATHTDHFHFSVTRECAGL
jgi:hypothetical protein